MESCLGWSSPCEMRGQFLPLSFQLLSKRLGVGWFIVPLPVQHFLKQLGMEGKTEEWRCFGSGKSGIELEIKERS